MIKDLKAGDPVEVGPYKLLGRLGAGGMGQVYLAKSPGGRLVAIKLIRPELAEERGFRTRFAGEIAAARNVSGIYTAAVVDADPDAELPWMATVYVPGPSLTDAVEDSGPLPVKTVLALAAGLAEALEAIHRAGLVHRDMKPSNVLLAADGPRVIDFGISRALERSMITTTGMVLGSPGFMSPEQAMGEQVGQPSDVFSLGAILAYAGCGAGPFGTGPTPALLYRVVREDADLSQVPARLRPLIEECLAKDPASRPTPSALLAALGDEVEVITGEWLPQAVADGIDRYRPTLSTPLPPSLREPDSVPVEPVPAAGEQAVADSLPVGDPTPLAGAPAAAATRLEYNLPETSLVAMPGAGAGRDPLAAAAAGGSGAATAGGTRIGGAVPAGPHPRRHRRRWPLPAAAAAVIVIVAVAALILTRSPGGPPKNGPGPSASLAGDLTSAPASPAGRSAAALKTAANPAGPDTGTAPGRQSASAPASSAPASSASASASASSSPAATVTASPATTATPTTATPTTSPAASPTSSPTPTSTATAAPTTSTAPASTPAGPTPTTAPATPAATSS